MSEPETKNPDAVMVDAGVFPGSAADKMLAVKKSYGPMLGHAFGSICIRNQGSANFITGHPDDTILFPTGHDRQGQPRYRWVEQGSGVQFGYLVEGAEDHRAK